MMAGVFVLFYNFIVSLATACEGSRVLLIVDMNIILYNGISLLRLQLM